MIKPFCGRLSGLVENPTPPGNSIKIKLAIEFQLYTPFAH